MISKAEGNYIRMSPTKIRLVADLVKGKTVEKALYILDNANKRSAVPIKKVLNSAFSNANHNRQDKFLPTDLCISKITSDGGPMLHRYRAATMGRAAVVKHRTSFIHVELDEVVKSKKTKAKKTGSK
ncbi:MAG: 50S ribosomal protein L22 [Candidatus Omnitrophica bacterium]|nr:50S ribosomal protein L22 [Candidatus Omnitrophota bacterium]